MADALLTFVGIPLTALITYISTRALDNRKWQRDQEAKNIEYKRQIDTKLQEWQREKDSEIQEWFEKHFIFEGIDALLPELSRLEHNFSNIRYRLRSFDETARVPNEALERVAILIDGGNTQTYFDFTNAVRHLFVKLHNIEPREIENNRLIEWQASISHITKNLRDLRVLLLERQITKKSQVYEIYKDPKVQTIVENLNLETEAVFKLVQYLVMSKEPRYSM